MADRSDPPASPSETERESLLKVVEQLAMIMAESGLPRMPARVFAYVLAEDAEIYTAGDLAEGLGVSPAAISGAVRYLVQTGLIAKERVPGDRRDHYRVFDQDVWGSMWSQQSAMLRRWADAFRDAVSVLGAERPGGRRLDEGRLFFEFMVEDSPRMLERWKAYREKHLGT